MKKKCWKPAIDFKDAFGFDLNCNDTKPICRASVSGGPSGYWGLLDFLEGQFCTCCVKKIYDFHIILGGKLIFFQLGTTQFCAIAPALI